jgi:hypothetical protein
MNIVHGVVDLADRSSESGDSLLRCGHEHQHREVAPEADHAAGLDIAVESHEQLGNLLDDPWAIAA